MQLRLDLNDSRNHLESLIKRTSIYPAEWYIFPRKFGKDLKSFQFVLGTRYHGPVETDYTYVEPVTYEDAVWLCKEFKVRQFCNCIYEFERKSVG